VRALWLLLCLAVAACADLDKKPWFRADGDSAPAEQLDLDRTTCRQEMKKYVEATTQAAVVDRNVFRTDVYESCMARLGYSDKRPAVPVVVQDTPPPPVAQGSPPPPVTQGRPTPPIARGRPTPPQGRPRPPVAQGGAAPPVAQGSPTPAVAQGSAPPPSAQQCRTPLDLRMWLPLCP
jgi:hypothetical protein